MAAEDYFDPYGELDEDAQRDRDEVRCSFCGDRDLHWEQSRGGAYLLMDEEGRQHKCHNVAKATEFPIED